MKIEYLGPSSDHAPKNLCDINMVAIGLKICNSWVGVASSLTIVIAAGGPVTLIYGIIIAFLFCVAVAASLAELASVTRVSHRGRTVSFHFGSGT